MMCWLNAPGHYPDQCNDYLHTKDTNPHVEFKIYTFEITAISPKWQWEYIFVDEMLFKQANEVSGGLAAIQEVKSFSVSVDWWWLWHDY